MKAGISTATLFVRKYNEESVSMFKEWGVDCAEVFYTTYSEYKPSFSELLASLKGDMEIWSVHALGTQFEPQLYNAHPRAKEDAFAILSEITKSAFVLGAKYYTFHGTSRMKRTFREDFESVGKGTAEIYQFCAERGLTLCFENVEWAFYNRPGVFRQLKARCPELKGVLDIKQARISGYPYEKYLEEMGENITHVHVSDITADGKMCLPGRGVFDFPTLIKRLSDVGFQGPLLIENYRTDYQDCSELRASYEYLKELTEKYAR